MNTGYVGNVEVKAMFKLTIREKEVLDLLIQGYTDKVIADKLYITINTAKKHASNIYNKYGAANKTHLTSIIWSEIMKNEFETLIRYLIKNLNTLKQGFGWKNNAERLHDGKYIAGEPFDYTFISKHGKIFVFDAKAIHSNSWKLLDKDIIQCNNMLKCIQNPNCKGFFIVYFYEHKTYRIIDCVDVSNTLFNGRKTVKFEEFNEIDLVKFLSEK